MTEAYDREPTAPSPAVGGSAAEIAAYWGLTVLRRRWPIVTLLILGSGVLAFALAETLVEKDWVATGKVVHKPLQAPDLIDKLMPKQQLDPRTLTHYVTAPNVIESLKKEFKLEIPHEILAERLIEVEPDPGSAAIIIKLGLQGPAETAPQSAAEMVNRLMELTNFEITAHRKEQIQRTIEGRAYQQGIERAKAKVAEEQKRLDDFRQANDLNDVSTDLQFIAADLARTIAARDAAEIEERRIRTELQSNDGRRQEAIQTRVDLLDSQIKSREADVEKLEGKLKVDTREADAAKRLFELKVGSKADFDRAVATRNETEALRLESRARVLSDRMEQLQVELLDEELDEVKAKINAWLRLFRFELSIVESQQSEAKLKRDLERQEETVRLGEARLRSGAITQGDHDLLVERKTKLEAELTSLRQVISDRQTKLATVDRNDRESMRGVPVIEIGPLRIPALLSLTKEHDDLQKRLVETQAKLKREEENVERARKRELVLRGSRLEFDKLIEGVERAKKGLLETEELLRMLQQQAGVDTDELEIMSRAVPPSTPSGRARLKFFVLALGCGVLLSILGVMGYDWATRTGPSGESVSVRFGLPILARPHLRTDLAAVVADRREHDQELRKLALRIRQSVYKPGSTILLTSLHPDAPLPGLLVPLADCFARRDERVLILNVGMDRGGLEDEQLLPVLSRPRNERRRGQSESALPGLAEFLSSELLVVEQIVHGTKIPDVDCVLAGRGRISPDALATQRMDGLMAVLGKKYSIILMAGPPVCRPVEVEILASRANGILFATAPTDGLYSEVRQVLEKLAEMQAPIVGATSLSYGVAAASAPVVRKPGKARWKESSLRHKGKWAAASPASAPSKTASW